MPSSLEVGFTGCHGFRGVQLRRPQGKCSGGFTELKAEGADVNSCCLFANEIQGGA